jgi:hypothetical protein
MQSYEDFLKTTGGIATDQRPSFVRLGRRICLANEKRKHRHQSHECLSCLPRFKAPRLASQAGSPRTSTLLLLQGAQRAWERRAGARDNTGR